MIVHAYVQFGNHGFFGVILGIHLMENILIVTESKINTLSNTTFNLFEINKLQGGTTKCHIIASLWINDSVGAQSPCLTNNNHGCTIVHSFHNFLSTNCLIQS